MLVMTYAFPAVFILAALAIVIQLVLGISPEVILVRVSVLVAVFSVGLSGTVALVRRYFAAVPGEEKPKPAKPERGKV